MTGTQRPDYFYDLELREKYTVIAAQSDRIRLLERQLTETKPATSNEEWCDAFKWGIIAESAGIILYVLYRIFS